MRAWFQIDSSISGQSRLRDASGWERRKNKISTALSETWRTEPEDSEKVGEVWIWGKGESLTEWQVAKACGADDVRRTIAGSFRPAAGPAQRFGRRSVKDQYRSQIQTRHVQPHHGANEDAVHPPSPGILGPVTSSWICGLYMINAARLELITFTSSDNFVKPCDNRSRKTNLKMRNPSEKSWCKRQEARYRQISQPPDSCEAYSSQIFTASNEILTYTGAYPAARACSIFARLYSVNYGLTPRPHRAVEQLDKHAFSGGGLPLFWVNFGTCPHFGRAHAPTRSRLSGRSNTNTPNQITPQRERERSKTKTRAEGDENGAKGRRNGRPTTCTLSSTVGCDDRVGPEVPGQFVVSIQLNGRICDRGTYVDVREKTLNKPVTRKRTPMLRPLRASPGTPPLLRHGPQEIDKGTLVAPQDVKRRIEKDRGSSSKPRKIACVLVGYNLHYFNDLQSMMHSSELFVAGTGGCGGVWVKRERKLHRNYPMTVMAENFSRNTHQSSIRECFFVLKNPPQTVQP
ncbi:hypothetical protein FB451DRAFT_1522092 [Mycena latifolia]|nr:hypothetical protein FB451DRAFT_1522092 [Mycena latifolia]